MNLPIIPSVINFIHKVSGKREECLASYLMLVTAVKVLTLTTFLVQPSHLVTEGLMRNSNPKQLFKIRTQYMSLCLLECVVLPHI